MNYMRGFMNLKEQKQPHREPACQKDAKEGDTEIQGAVITGDPTLLRFFLYAYKGREIRELRVSWDRARLGRPPNVVEMIISGWGPIQLAWCLVSKFFCNVKRKCVLAVS